MKIACSLPAALALLSVAALGDDLPAGLSQFQPVTDLPSFQGAPGHWDAAIRERGWVLHDKGQWRLWYTGYVPDAAVSTMQPGLATSSDGIHWVRSQPDPLIADLWVEDMMIVPHDGQLFMFAEGMQDQAQLLQSEDGVHWISRGTLDIRLSSGDPIPPGPFGTPTAFFEDGVWNLFYERRDAGIWLARSTDLLTWTNVQDDPVLLPGPEEYDRLMIAMNQVIRIDEQYVAVLHGTGTETRPRQWCTYLAVSRDLLHWSKAPGSPLRPVAENKSSGQLVQLDDGRWRLYTMHGQVMAHESAAKDVPPAAER